MSDTVTIGLGQIDTVPGDLPGNLERCRTAATAAAAAGVDLLLLPELALPGYAPRDILLRQGFASACERALLDLARSTAQGPALIVGTLGQAHSGPVGRSLTNEAVLLESGAVVARVAKRLLPNYDIFDELRYFQPGSASRPITWRGWQLGLTVCEDLWVAEDPGGEAPRYGQDPAAELVAAGAELVINLSASPYARGRRCYRRTLVRDTALRLGRPVVLCNRFGADDEILYDGSSLAVAASGQVITELAPFQPGLATVRLERDGEGAASLRTHSAIPTEPPAAAPQEPRTEPTDHEEAAELAQALVMGIRGYCSKVGIRGVVLGVSGGIDSALVAALAAEALGGEQVLGLAMPTRFSSPGSLSDARELCEANGIRYREQPIDEAYAGAAGMLDAICGEATFGVAEENLQSRLRGLLVMAAANREGRMALATGNKSEMAMGYCTLYGDMCGGLAPIADLYKHQVIAVAEHYAARGLLPHNSITKPPSAELRPDQLDSDSLPPYPVLDGILEAFLEARKPAAVIAAEHPDWDPAVIARVIRATGLNEHKRWQAAPILRVSRKAFGHGRRIPVLHRDPGAHAL